jgi:hypothetical protein
MPRGIDDEMRQLTAIYQALLPQPAELQEIVG